MFLFIAIIFILCLIKALIVTLQHLNNLRMKIKVHETISYRIEYSVLQAWWSFYLSSTSYRREHKRIALYVCDRMSLYANRCFFVCVGDRMTVYVMQNVLSRTGASALCCVRCAVCARVYVRFCVVK